MEGAPERRAVVRAEGMLVAVVDVYRLRRFPDLGGRVACARPDYEAAAKSISERAARRRVASLSFGSCPRANGATCLGTRMLNTKRSAAISPRVWAA